ncbi:MAG: shikimate dehydrogenase [Gluconacetobacter diazotrophicus]|nr:shikimate dehydrogenase [Gluconacetobacter diazotrophicus]
MPDAPEPRPLVAATLPTLHFIGVSTRQSSIMRIFPAWAEALELGPCAINGIDLELHAPAAAYREVVAFIRDDALSRGALVTAHKIDLLHASADLFDELDPHAAALREVSCLSKRNGKLVGHAKDPISATLALDAILPSSHWRDHDSADALLLGAGGATTAISQTLMQAARAEGGPRRIVVTDVREDRLRALRRFHDTMPGRTTGTAVEYVLTNGTAEADAILDTLGEGSLVVNASGLGKDRPGSPLGPRARFPHRGVAWELNYRGDLLFLDAAEAQAAERALRTVDGWNYFLHGWTRVIAEVFDMAIPTTGPGFERLSALAGGAPRRAGAAP